MKKLEIYGTLGPSCCDKETLRAMFKTGMNGIRLNLSHCNLWDKKTWIDNVHEVTSELGMTPSILIDMKGRELRLKISDETTYLPKGSTITLSKIFLPEEIIKYAEPTDILLIDDGRLRLQVEYNDGTFLSCKTISAGYLQGKKSIAIEHKSILGNVLNENDIANLKKASEYGVSGIMQPFVCSAQDLIDVKNVLKDLHLDLKVYAKIENMEGFYNLESLFPYCDEIIIARGDLGNACGLTKLPIIQHKIETLCKKANKPYMVVTQMLDSMHENGVPTRAEVNDIFNAVYKGADAIMLTGETANGSHPVEAMRYFVECAHEALQYKEEQ